MFTSSYLEKVSNIAETLHHLFLHTFEALTLLQVEERTSFG